MLLSSTVTRQRRKFYGSFENSYKPSLKNGTRSRFCSPVNNRGTHLAYSILIFKTRSLEIPTVRAISLTVRMSRTFSFTCAHITISKTLKPFIHYSNVYFHTPKLCTSSGQREKSSIFPSKMVTW